MLPRLMQSNRLILLRDVEATSVVCFAPVLQIPHLILAWVPTTRLPGYQSTMARSRRCTRRPTHSEVFWSSRARQVLSNIVHGYCTDMREVHHVAARDLTRVVVSARAARVQGPLSRAGSRRLTTFVAASGILCLLPGMCTCICLTV